jgi:hypothetical protein
MDAVGFETGGGKASGRKGRKRKRRKKGKSG